MKEFGVNVNGEGEPIGIWFDPIRAVVDGSVYIDLTLNELTELLLEYCRLYDNV